ncbi:MAG: tetratricopeptide repeat protein [Candidatus Brocadiales bacterium]
MEKLSGSYQLSSITMPQYNFELRSNEFKRSGEDFTIWFFEGVLEKNPNYIDCLMYLGNAYTASGRHEEGMKIDKRLVELRPKDPLVRYNFACSCSLLGDVDTALRELETSITLGYKDVRHIEMDRDLDRLRDDKRYWELIAQIKRAGTTIGDSEDK